MRGPNERPDKRQETKMTMTQIRPVVELVISYNDNIGGTCRGEMGHHLIHPCLKIARGLADSFGVRATVEDQIGECDTATATVCVYTKRTLSNARWSEMRAFIRGVMWEMYN